MLIHNLQIKGFRSFRDAGWRPGRLNVVIGPNAGGKSNLLQFLEFLSAAARGELSNFIVQQGGIQPLLWNSATDSISSQLTLLNSHEIEGTAEERFDWQFAIRQLGPFSGYRVESESLSEGCRDSGQEYGPLTLMDRGPDNGFVVRDGSRADLPMRTGRSGVQNDESALAALVLRGNDQAIDQLVRRQVEEWFVSRYVDTAPNSEMRSAVVARFSSRLERDGGNLCQFLHTQYSRDSQFREKIDDTMFAAFGREYRELLFPPAADQRIQLAVNWSRLASPRPAAELSDGTLRYLFLMAALRQPNPPPLIAIDEPETGLHPRMMDLVAETASVAAERSQVVLSTHSPVLLDHLSEYRPSVAVLESHEGETVLRQPSDESLDHWLKYYRLGELQLSGELEALE